MLRDAASVHTRLSELIKTAMRFMTWKEKLSEFDPHMLSDDQQILYDSLSERIETGLMAEGLELYDQPLAPPSGSRHSFRSCWRSIPFHSLQDVEDYLLLCSPSLIPIMGISSSLKSRRRLPDSGPSDASIKRILESCQSYLHRSR